MPDIALIICTYNPDPSSFKRVLDSISALIIPPDCIVECCLVDNNSQPPLASIDYVQDFLAKTPWANVITEAKQSAATARRTGMAATTAPILLLLDDDNQLDPNYVVSTIRLSRQYPDVGVWGPGRVRVEFTEAVDTWVEANKWLFQERDTSAVDYGREPYWTSHHPPGTGQVIRRDVMMHYKKLADSNAITLLGRTGKSLSSGEDAQVVYTAIKQGYAVGMSPDLIIYHLIPRKRTHITYVRKLLYNIMSSGAVANVEIFPDQKARYQVHIRSSRHILIKLIRIAGSSIRDRSLTRFQMNSSLYLGELAGSYEAVTGKLPYWLTLSVRLLKLQ